MDPRFVRCDYIEWQVVEIIWTWCRDFDYEVPIHVCERDCGVGYAGRGRYDHALVTTIYVWCIEHVYSIAFKVINAQ
jgi:hypothetical protein